MISTTNSGASGEVASKTTLNSAESSALRIAIQGVHGAFHEIAAHRFHSDHTLEIVPANTFDEVVRFTEDGFTEGGMMAIENTIAGSLLRNYNLLNNSNLEIEGEVFLRIKQNLMAMPGVGIADLKEVHSHPIALQQCEEFFENYPHIRLVEAHDTALVAQEIRAKKLKKIGAVGSLLAAEIYDLNVLADSIETYKKNYTRFWKLRIKQPDIVEIAQDFDKISMVFSTQHAVGSLHKALEILAKNNCNMTKIQSAPIMDKPWEYLFFVDFTFTNSTDYKAVLSQLDAVTVALKVLGKYKSGLYFE
jgi:prephenate dehydratase